MSEDNVGKVVFFDDEVQGWVNELRDPEHWQPGCIAIDEFGLCYKTVGGNQKDGAARWQVLTSNDEARAYNRMKDPQAKTCACAECGTRISMTGDNCFSFGVYLCPDCRKQRKRVEPWTVLVSDLPKEEQEPFWKYIISCPRSIPPLLPGDPPGDKRAWLADYKRFKIYPHGEFLF